RGAADAVGEWMHGEPRAAWFGRSGPLGVRRSALVAAAVVFFGLRAGGVGARALLEPEAPPPMPRKAQAPAGPGFSAPPAAVASVSPDASSRKLTKKSDKPLAAGAARLELADAPWGQALVDGRTRGVSPPRRPSH